MIITNLQGLTAAIVDTVAWLRLAFVKLTTLLTDLIGYLWALLFLGITAFLVIVNTMLAALGPLYTAVADLTAQVENIHDNVETLTIPQQLVHTVAWLNYCLPIDEAIWMTTAYVSLLMTALLVRMIMALIPSIG